MSPSGGSFADLRVRLISAVVLLGVGVGAIWAGGAIFLVFLAAVAGLMIWELIRMLDPEMMPSKAILLALVAGAAVLRVGYDSGPLALSALLLAPVVGFVMLRRDRLLFLVYGTLSLGAVASLFWIRDQTGLGWTIWLVFVVVAADIGGYFFGRILGGPKIFPAISPKKTWSGTLGGWFLAAMVGVGFIFWRGGGWEIVMLSVLTAAASQLGDMAESAIKRHAGCKDSSTLIPGHGGFLDRFDALIGASLFVALWSVLAGLPLDRAV